MPKLCFSSRVCSLLSDAPHRRITTAKDNTCQANKRTEMTFRRVSPGRGAPDSDLFESFPTHSVGLASTASYVSAMFLHSRFEKCCSLIKTMFLDCDLAKSQQLRVVRITRAERRATQLTSRSLSAGSCTHVESKNNIFSAFPSSWLRILVTNQTSWLGSQSWT